MGWRAVMSESSFRVSRRAERKADEKRLFPFFVFLARGFTFRQDSHSLFHPNAGDGLSLILELRAGVGWKSEHGHHLGNHLRRAFLWIARHFDALVRSPQRNFQAGLEQSE